MQHMLCSSKANSEERMRDHFCIPRLMTYFFFFSILLQNISSDFPIDHGNYLQESNQEYEAYGDHTVHG